MWLTSQFRFFAGDRPLEELGLGRTRCRSAPPSCSTGWSRSRVALRWLRTNIPLMAHDTPGRHGRDPRDARPTSTSARARPARAARAARRCGGASSTYLQPGPAAGADALPDVRAHEPDGERIGWVNFYLPAAPASIVSLITRGNQGMFARMAELLEPARHETAILFADIQASSRAGAPPLDASAGSS